jgi:hypothetical protein
VIGSSEHPLFTFGVPPDVVAWGALVVALLAFFARRPPPVKPRVVLAALVILAAGLSWGYFSFYLGGAPRIIDATTYLLEARSFAAGSFSFPVPEPTAAFRGRFLIHTAADAQRLAGIFPPGYPMILALGVLVGSYKVVGPLLAGGLVLMTYKLTFSVTRRTRDALVAATLSALCACLRYHCAETMSHGWAALLSVTAIWAAVELMRGNSKKLAFLLGVSLGMLLATRQLTGLLLLGSLGFALGLQKRRPLLGFAVPVVAGLVPGVLLLLAHQYALTGDAFLSPQLRYYALADGPAHCFRLGLGSGCHYEHADVVAQQGGQGLTLKWAGLNTLHRFHFHLMDVANFEPLILAGLFIAYKGRKRRNLWPLLIALLVIPTGYSLFYFAGSYPGGGARLFAELLPVWHALIALGLCTLRVARWGVIASLLGFAVHASYSHGMLKSPHFGPSGAAVADIPTLLKQHQTSREKANGSQRPVVFFSTAHEFNLSTLSDSTYLAARRTRDDRESLLAANAGAPSALFFHNGPNGPELLRLEPDQKRIPGQYVLETEFDYPPREARDLWVHPEHLSASCVSRGRALAIHNQGPAPRLTLEATGVPPGAYDVEISIVRAGARCDVISRRGLPLPGLIQLSAEDLSNLSHIDRMVLTFTHL